MWLGGLFRGDFGYSFEYDLPDVSGSDVDIEVISTGICHSDLSIVDDEWGISDFPVVPGHEVIGRVARM